MPEKAQPLMYKAQSLARDSDDLLLKVAIDCAIAESIGYTGNAEKSLVLLTQSIGHLRAVRDADPDALAGCYNSRSFVRMNAGDARGALDDADEALRIYGRPNSVLPANAVYLRSAKADALGWLGESSRAAAEYQIALQELNQIGRGATPMAAKLHNNLVVILINAGQINEAWKVCEAALKIEKNIDDGAQAAPALSGNCSRVLAAQGHGEAALPLIEIAKLRALRGGDTRWQAGLPLREALIREDLGLCEPCDALLAHADQRMPAIYPAQHAQMAALHIAKGRLASARHQYPLALQHLNQALAMYEALGLGDMMKSGALFEISRTELRSGQLESAAQHAKRALLLATKALGGFEHSLLKGQALAAQAAVLRAQGNLAGARAALEQALPELLASVGDSGPATQDARRLQAALEAH